MTTPPPIPGPLEPTKKTRSVFSRIFFWICKATGILILLIVLLVVVLANWPDKPEFDDSRLIPVWADDMEENPLALFEIWLEANRDLLPEDGDDRLKISREDSEWDGEIADELLSEYQPALQQLRLLIEKADEPWQWKGGSEVADFSAEYPNLSLFLKLSQLVRIQCIRQIELGRYDEALQSAGDLITLGDKLSQAKGSLIHYLVGSSIGGIGVKSIEQLANSHKDWLSPERYKNAINILNQSEPRPNDLLFTLKSEYLSFKKMIADLEAGKLETPRGTPLWKTRKGSAFLQRNETLAFYYEILEPLISELESEDFPRKPVLDEYETKVRSIRMNMVRFLVHPNVVGKITVVMAAPSVAIITRKAVEITATNRTVKTLLAIKMYESEKGRLPESLISLVPEYLASVPIDPFSEEALIWDTEKRIVYSTGRDRIDNGGAVHLKRHKEGSDIGVKLGK